MFINAIACTNNLQNKSTPTSFKQGLTRDIVTHVKNMPSDEYQRITQRMLDKYHIWSDVWNSNVVAFCLEQTVEIMHKAGFEIPETFAMRKSTRDVLGQYYNFTVSVNPNLKEFFDIEKLNKMESNNGRYSRHFLSTYLHEFSHAAHHKHIMGKCSDAPIVFENLKKIKPNTILRKPLVLFIKKLCPDISKNQINKLFPNENKLFREECLCEYFAEKNTQSIIEQLGKNFCTDNIKLNFVEDYKGFPVDWSLDGELKKISKYSNYYKDIKNVVECNLGYFEGEIWNGNTEIIKDKSAIFTEFGNSNKNN